MNKYLAYQFVGRSDDLHKIPGHIKNIKSKLGYEEKEKQAVEELIPELKRRARAQSIPEKHMSKQVLLNNLTRRLATLRQEYDKVCYQMQRQHSHRTNIKNPKTVFEQHFSKMDMNGQMLEEQRNNLQNQIKLLKKEIFIIESQSDMALSTTGKKVAATNKSVLLSDLVIIEKKSTYQHRNLPKLSQLYQSQQMDTHGSPKQTLVSEFKVQNTNESNLVELFDSDEELTMPKSNNIKLPTIQQLVDQLDQMVAKPNDRLPPSKEALRQFRLQKYENYLIRHKIFTRKKKSFRAIGAVVLFVLLLIKQTKISQQRYSLLCKQYQSSNFQKCNQECLFFVNNIIGKQVLCKISRLQQLQKCDKKQLRQLNPITAVEIVREILQKLQYQRFSGIYYSFIYSISTVGYYPLINYHSKYIRSKMVTSSVFNYLLDDCRRVVMFETIILKNIIFYGLFYRAHQLFSQLKVDLDRELIQTVSVILIELFLKSQGSTCVNVNFKNLTNLQVDGQMIQQEMREMDQIKMKLLNYIDLTDLMKQYNQMIEKQYNY